MSGHSSISQRGSRISADGNLDFDFKRQLECVSERDGVLAASTRPWRSVEEFSAFRDNLEAWKKTYKRVLRTRQDWEDFIQWRADKPRRRAVGSTSKSNLPPIAIAFTRAWARKELGLPGGRYKQIAEEMTEVGWPATVNTFKNAKRRGNVPIERISILTLDDEGFISWTLARWPEWDVEALARPASKAAEHIKELRCRCQSSYPVIEK